MATRAKVELLNGGGVYDTLPDVAASGGEADVYFYGDKAVKIYKERVGSKRVREQRFGSDDIAGKIRALQGLPVGNGSQYIIMPKGLVKRNDENAGYWMDK